jgi:hypothetical protein
VLAPIRQAPNNARESAAEGLSPNSHFAFENHSSADLSGGAGFPMQPRMWLRPLRKFMSRKSFFCSAGPSQSATKR